MIALTSDTGAHFTPDRLYRYALWRRFAPLLDRPAVAFLGLNPSTADESQDDPTIRRCLGFARSWGYGTLIMLNLYGWRSTDPKPLWGLPDPVGPGHDEALLGWGKYAGTVVAAWGAFPQAQARGFHVVRMLDDAGVRVQVLDLTKDGCPRHPLYARGDLVPSEWSP